MAFHDSSEDTIRHTKCDLLLSSDSGDRCQQCTTYRYIIQLLSSVHWINPSVWINPFFISRKTLLVLSGRLDSHVEPNASSHCNFRYLSQSEKVARLHEMRHKNKVDQVRGLTKKNIM